MGSDSNLQAEDIFCQALSLTKIWKISCEIVGA
jgi:hypothetical protein